MSSNLQNSIWPNAGGTLGQNKVQIPDGINVTWPEGDVLVGNFVYNKGKLVGFVDTKALIANSSKTTTFPYDYVNISLPSIAEGEMTYNYDQCAYVVLNGEVLKGDVPTNDDLEEINFKYMGCKTVADIKAVDPNYLTNDIVDGDWIESLADLEIGGNGRYDGGMFFYCAQLQSFTSDLSKLTDGNNMFYQCSNLKSFDADLSSLTNGFGMFAYNSVFGEFISDLSSLTDGGSMFDECKLNTASIKNIADTINTVTNRPLLTLGIANYSPSEEENIYLTQIYNKGWKIYVNGYGNLFTPPAGDYGYTASASLASSLTTLDETGESEMFAPKPYWAKPFPATQENARYIDSEGNFYNILGAQFIYVDDPETYGMFINEDDAAAQMRLTKIEK